MNKKDRQLILEDGGHYWVEVNGVSKVGLYNKSDDTFEVMGSKKFSAQHCKVESSIILKPTKG